MSREAKASGEMKNVKKSTGLFFTTQTIICETQARRAVFFFRKEKQQGRSSKEERKVNALALRADEGRDNLR